MKLALCQMRMSADETGTPAHPCPQVHAEPTSRKGPAHFAQDPFFVKNKERPVSPGLFFILSPPFMHLCMAIMHN